MSLKNSSAVIRAARPNDVPLLRQFIQQLAEAEGFPGPVVVTEADLLRRLFGSEQLAEAVIVEYEQRPVGFAVFYLTFSTTTGKAGLHLDDVYLEPALQGRGLGKQLFAWLAAEALRRDCTRFEWWSLRWNEQANAFYQRLHASARDELQIYRLDQEGMRRVAAGE